MSIMDEEDYGEIPDEDMIKALSYGQTSQTLPRHPLPPAKRRRISASTEDAISDEDLPLKFHRKRHYPTGRGGSGDDGDEEEDRRPTKRHKYKVHIHDKRHDVPEAIIVGPTQADGMPDSPPYRIRGPIYRKPRLEAPTSAAPTAAPHNIATQFNFHPGISSGPSEDFISRELEDLPSDAFASSLEIDIASNRPTIRGPSSTIGTQSFSNAQSLPQQRLVAPQNGLRQTTLFGGRAPVEDLPPSQVNKMHNYRVDMPPESPTHHILDHEALKSWVYPTNLGATREYQFSIVKNALFNNLLVALPTGLGKTFIAATVMFNYFRWTKNAQIVFMAPTKPLIAQQAKACFDIVGIPKSATTMLTGETGKALRADEWAEKRVFFMTPQTFENDLGYGYADPKRIVLLVVDEAHRATGGYAYVKVVSFLRRFNKSFRVLALTATPGASVEAVQEVIDGLEISKVEIRTEESIDIQQFVHQRKIEQIVLDPSDEILMVKELFSKALQPLVNQLCAQNAYWNKDPMSLTSFGLIQAQKKWQADAGRRAHQGLKAMMGALFSILASVAHGIKLLNFHGIGPFFSTLKDLREEVENGATKSKYKRQIVESPEFKKLMACIQMWLSKEDFVGHPKMTFLCDTILNHFLDAGEGRLPDGAPPSNTRVIVFAEFRDSAEDIVRVLNRHKPMIRASVFVGQADSKRSEGMNQEKQQETILKFKTGSFNVLVATCIGEEGLDIGQVDLIVCYDASGSPIRMLQRMGRTGRKRAGKIVLLLMRGKEEEAFTKAKDNYEQMQKMISSGARFNFRHDLSVRIIPRDVKPVVDKRMIVIPIENTQDPSMPEPKRGRRSKSTKKAPSKKFHMPDGVETGFRKASRISEAGVFPDLGITVSTSELNKDQVAPIPSLDSILLNPAQMHEFQRSYLMVAGVESQEVGIPDMTSQFVSQRSLGPSVKVPHSQYTKRCVRLFKKLADSQAIKTRHVMPYGNEEPTDMSWILSHITEDEDETPKMSTRHKTANQRPRKRGVGISDDATDEESDRYVPAERQQPRNRVAFFCESQSEGETIGPSSREKNQDSETEDYGSLKDFIVEDDEDVTVTMRRLPSTGESTSLPSIEPKTKLFFEPTQFTATQDSVDDDLPDVKELINTKTIPMQWSLNHDTSDDDMPEIVAVRPKASLQPPLKDTGKNVRQVSGGRTKRRRIIEEDDSDQ